MTIKPLPESKKRITWVDTAKGISILLVVILHARNELSAFSINSDALDHFVEVFANLRMPLFFAVAGLFAGKWIQAPWQQLINNKVALLLWAFLAWQPIILFYKLLDHAALNSLGAGVIGEEIVRAFLSPLRPNGELWFLWTLVIFFLFARMTKEISVKIQFFGAIVVSICWMSIIEPLMSEMVFRAVGSGWNGLFRYYFLFIGFSLFSKQIVSLVSRCPWYGCVLSFLFWLLAAVFSAYFNVPAAATLFPLTILGVIGGLGLAKIISFLHIFQYFGKRTLQIYLAHSALITLFTCFAVFIGLGPWWQSHVGISVALLVSLSIIGALLLSRIKPLKILYEQPSWFHVGSHQFDSYPRTLRIKKSAQKRL